MLQLSRATDSHPAFPYAVEEVDDTPQTVHLAATIERLLGGDGDIEFWKPHYEYKELNPPRAMHLDLDFNIFRNALRALQRWGSQTMPGVFFKNGSLPSNPAHPGLTIGGTPLFSELREHWNAHRDRTPLVSRHTGETDGQVIEMPLPDVNRRPI